MFCYHHQTHQTFYLVVLFLLVMLLTWPQGAFGQDIKQKYKNLTVNANLELAEGKTLQDGVVLITHALLQHNRMEIIRTTQALLKDHGYSSLAINYSLNVDDRHGVFNCMTPHRHIRQAAIEEIGFWIGWLKKQGVKNMVLVGHSTGANEVAMYDGLYPDPVISRVIMITPATTDHASNTPAGYRTRYNKDLNVVLAQAQKLIAEGHGDQIMEHTDFLFCPDAPVSAASFVSYYGTEAGGISSVRLLPSQLKNLNVPTLIIAAGEDNLHPDMAAIVEPHVDGKRLQLVTIEGASHFLRDLYLEDAVDAMVTFLKQDNLAEPNTPVNQQHAGHPANVLRP